MSEVKLLPCPFCGGEAYTYTATSVANGEKTKVWQVHCSDCHLNYPLNIKCLTEEEAINAWNRRKPMKRILERLKEESFHRYNDTKEEKLITLDKALEVVKEGGIE